MATIDVLHENAARAAPRFGALERRALPVCDWLLPASGRSLDANAVAVAAFELITGRRGVAYAYDVNTSTNPEAEAAAGPSAMAALADLLGRELAALQTPLVAAD